MCLQPEGNAVIASYAFGRMVIDGVEYHADLIISSTGVMANWRRQSGHMLEPGDIRDALDAAQPRFLVVGTGKFGMMQISDAVRMLCEEQQIRLHSAMTDKAVKIYNRIILIDDRVTGAFHLTC